MLGSLFDRFPDAPFAQPTPFADQKPKEANISFRCVSLSSFKNLTPFMIRR